MTMHHVFMPIDAAEKMTDAELARMFKGSAADTRIHLAQMRYCGMEVIPSADCDRRDSKGYCLGHDQPSIRRCIACGATEGGCPECQK